MTYKIAFSLAKNLSGDTALQLLRIIGSPRALFEYSQSQLESLSGVQAEVFKDEKRKELLARAREELLFVENGKAIECKFIGEEGYPHRLAFCEDAPSLLYQCGRADLNAKNVVGIVGTRHATHYGVDFTSRLVEDLAGMFPGIVIVSGLAFGVDVAAHKAAMSANTPTIAVMAHGLDMVYPAEHRQIAAKIVGTGGAIVTEYPSRTHMNRGYFLARNRIVAGLCDCLVVIESDIKGGSMSTARLAREYGREVLALPGRSTDIYSKGTNHLIATDRARLITSAADLANAMMWEPVKKAENAEKQLFRPLNPEEQQVYDFIIENPEATENDICVNLALPFSKLSSIIFSLEMEDFIMKVPGGHFLPTTK